MVEGILLDVSNLLKTEKKSGIPFVEEAYLNHFSSRQNFKAFVEYQGMVLELSADLLKKISYAQIPHYLQSGDIKKINFSNHSAVLNLSHDTSDKAIYNLPGTRKYVYFLHDLIPILYPQFVRPGDDIIFEKRLTFTVNFADLIICSTMSVKNNLEDWLSQKTFKIRANVVVAPLGPSVVPEQDEASACSFDVLPSDYCLYVSTIEPRKNHKVLFSAWHKIIENNRDFDVPKLVLVGRRGWLNEDVFRYMDNNAQFRKFGREMGYVSQSILRRLYGSCDCVLFPSISEGFGLSLVEAMVFGKDIICSDIPVFREVCGNYPRVKFVNPLRPDDWVAVILEITSRRKTYTVDDQFQAHGWSNHFSIVQSFIDEL